jgi:hypothetical protein
MANEVINRYIYLSNIVNNVANSEQDLRRRKSHFESYRIWVRDQTTLRLSRASLQEVRS